jgi:hypothetical protein
MSSFKYVLLEITGLLGDDRLVTGVKNIQRSIQGRSLSFGKNIIKPQIKSQKDGWELRFEPNTAKYNARLFWGTSDWLTPLNKKLVRDHPGWLINWCNFCSLVYSSLIDSDGWGPVSNLIYVLATWYNNISEQARCINWFAASSTDMQLATAIHILIRLS